MAFMTQADAVSAPATGPAPTATKKSSAPAKPGRRKALAVVREQNDLLHHHVRLVLDRLLVERLRLDDGCPAI